MNRGARIAIAGLLGAGIGGVLSAAVYLLMTALDSSATAEAMAFSVFFGIGGAVAGLALGIVIGALQSRRCWAGRLPDCWRRLPAWQRTSSPMAAPIATGTS